MSFFLGSFCAASWQTNGPVRTAYAARSNNDCPFGQCSFKRGSARGLRVQPSATRGGTAGRMRSAASTSVILRSFSGSNSFPGWPCYDWAFYPPPYYGFGPLPSCGGRRRPQGDQCRKGGPLRGAAQVREETPNEGGDGRKDCCDPHKQRYIPNREVS